MTARDVHKLFDQIGEGVKLTAWQCLPGVDGKTLWLRLVFVNREFTVAIPAEVLPRLIAGLEQANAMLKANEAAPRH